MINLYLAWMEFFSTEVTRGPFETYDFLSQVSPSMPAFVSAPESFEREHFLSFYVLFVRIGVEFRPSQRPMGSPGTDARITPIGRWLLGVG